MTRYDVAKIEIMQSKIKERRDKAARIRASVYDPARAAISEAKRPPDIRKREKMLTSAIDEAKELDIQADNIQVKLDKMLELLSEYLDKNDCINRETKRIVRLRLLKGYTWSDVAELSGYSERACTNKYKRWYESLK